MSFLSNTTTKRKIKNFNFNSSRALQSTSTKGHNILLNHKCFIFKGIILVPNLASLGSLGVLQVQIYLEVRLYMKYQGCIVYSVVFFKQSRFV